MGFLKPKAPTVVNEPTVKPTAPVTDTAAVQTPADENQKKKTRAGKSTLKIPLASSTNTGLKA